LTNSEAPAEPAKETTEFQYKIPCNIAFEGNPINYLQDGIKLGLTGSVTKHSDTLNRDAVYQKVSRISHLPGYLVVHFVRFFYKQANVSAGTRAGKAKILRVIYQ
jgi:ubiquitin carboxyl-terminal hydrolase 14